jgi:Lipid A 3-O-deacylase (PagL)
MISVCMLLWCLGQSIAPDDRVTFTNDMRHANGTERIFAYEMSWLVGGVVAQTPAEDAVFAGALPLNIRLLGDRLTFTGGVVIASQTVPSAGTHANFMARLQLPLTDRFALTYWHWSNAHLGQHNPSVDSIGVTLRVRKR